MADFKSFEYYTNRELSWLKFNRRVLYEAKDKNLPILDRLKFVSITSSNLDEFFMVRVASLKDMVHADIEKTDISGMTPKQQLGAIGVDTKDLVETQYALFNRSLMPILSNSGIKIITDYKELDEEQAEYIDNYFVQEIYPVLTPMAVDASRPFPLIRNKTLNIASLLAPKAKQSGLLRSNSSEVEFATVQVPSVLPRLIPVPSSDYKYCFLLLEQAIEKNISKLYLNYDVITSCPYRIMRNADLSFDEDAAEDLLIEIERQLKKRQWGEVIRLEVEHRVDSRLLDLLKEYLNVKDYDVFPINGPIDLTFLMKLYGLKGCDNLREPSYAPQISPRMKDETNIFKAIRKGDILLHHPYESFDPVVDFIKTAATDKNVLAIKMTLYRVSGNSPIIYALEKAAENGKQVTVLVELKARFDEENNIVWARKLEQAGCHVIYGLVGLKTHSKIALVIRKEDDQIRRYVHLGTGNYNDSTAKLYTDCGVFTCKDDIGQDATAVFNMLSGYSEPANWNQLIVAPIWLREKFLKLIKRETKNAKAGKEARIIAKMNSLCDKEIIEALYEASSSGVKIDLIIRGICCLKTDIDGVSKNITVHSIVGTFLEHARIFYFYNNGMEEFYMGSADWMPRNLDKRVEIVFPVLDDKLKEQVRHILDVQLRDNTKAYRLNADGEYTKVKRRAKELVGAQKQFCHEAISNNPKAENAIKSRVFIPITSDNEDL